MAEAERRLAAIVAMDVAGYSRLMGEDEQGTLHRLTEHRAVIDPIGTEHGGRIVGTAGDGVLVEFPSVIEAVGFALRSQAVMAERNADIADDQKMLFRIGINLGDVLVQDGDIFGDGVNVAARIEALAEPGGICISRTVRDNVRDRMDLDFDDMGEVEVKNIARPVRVFRVSAEPDVIAAIKPTAAPTSASTQTTPRRVPWRIIAAAAAVLVIVIAGGGYWWWQQPDFQPADPAKFAFKLPEKPSIAVLPFDNLSADQSQEYLADSLSENVIAVLATSPDLFVIARNSSFTYKGKAIKVQVVAEQLGVRYVVEGSLQRDGGRIRVTAQLVDAVTGRHLWSERYDRELTDLFAVQDEIAQKIALELQVALVVGDTARIWSTASADDLETLRLYREANAIWQKFTPEGNHRAEELTRKALARQPENVLLNSFMGWIAWQRVRAGFSEDRAKDMTAARAFAAKARTIDDRYPSGHLIPASLDVLEKKHASAVAQAARAVELAPNSGVHVAIAAWVMMMSGQPRQAIELYSHAIALQRQHYAWQQLDLATSYSMIGAYDKARQRFAGLLASSTRSAYIKPRARFFLIAIAVWEGNLDEARQDANRLIEGWPEANLRTIAAPWDALVDRDFIERYLAALRQAGIPDLPPSERTKYKLPEKPSIAILPFANLSDDKDQEYFADGMTDDLITDLSNISGLIVIARNSVFTYKGKNVKVQEIARDLNVTHVLEGSVRRDKSQVRINAQLIDAKTGAHLWGETFDRLFKDIFALQDEITAKIVAAMQVSLTPVEKKVVAKLPTKDVVAYDHFLKAENLRLTFDWKNYDQALAEYRAALSRDPRFVAAHLGLARALVRIWRSGWTTVMPVPSQALSEAIDTLQTVDRLDPASPHKSVIEIRIAYLQGDIDNGLEMAKAAVDKYPSDVELQYRLAHLLVVTGALSEAQAVAKQALLLSVRPDRELWPRLAWIFAYVGDYDRAKDMIERARTAGADRFETAYTMARVLVGLGDLEAAKNEVQTIKARWGGANLQLLRVLYQHHKDPSLEQRLFEPLTAAGIPEWPQGVQFDESKRLDNRGLETLFTRPFSIEGAFFDVIGIKENLLCSKRGWRLMGRSVCRPVYHDPQFVKELTFSDHQYIAPSVHDEGYDVFSVRRGSQ